ncbi:MAG: HD domain-containing protein [Candidatus Omnitrophica bacterium]|nr:HD domain-containing protein [Candidatus Omnitrophota bacterium]
MGSEKIENFLKSFLVAWQMARIYELEHPKFKQSLEDMMQKLESAFSFQDEVVIGIFSDEFASGDDVFFELSRKVLASIDYLKNLGIERLSFTQGLSQDEFIIFFRFLMMPVEEINSESGEFIKNMGIKNIKVGKLKAEHIKEDSRENLVLKKLGQYQACLENTASTLESFIADSAVDTLRLRFVSNKIMDNLIGDHKIFLQLIDIKDHDISTFMHLLNVCILSMYFSFKLGFSRQDCLNVGTAGLFHDIGKIYISKKILQKPGGLNSEEFSRIKSHTILGSEMLLKCRDTITILPSVVAFEHHRQWDGGGYPQASYQRMPHIASFIIAICDVYDAFSQKRTYKVDYPSEAIYRFMLKEKGRKFHPELIEIFFKIVGVWPRGTIVELNDERVAIVRQINEDEIFSPKVEVVSQEPREMIDLAKNNEVKISRSLNSLSEGKKYIDMI